MNGHKTQLQPSQIPAIGTLFVALLPPSKQERVQAIYKHLAAHGCAASFVSLPLSFTCDRDFMAHIAAAYGVVAASEFAGRFLRPAQPQPGNDTSPPEAA